MDRGELVNVARRSDCRLHVGQQVRELVVAGLHEVHFVAHPVQLALGAVAGFQLIGCLYLVGRGRQRFWVAQLRLPLDHGELRAPDAPEQAHR